jgi:hypothetical protein
VYKLGEMRTDVSTLTGLGRSMGVVTTELAVGLLAIFRFTGIVDSAVVLQEECEPLVNRHSYNQYSRRSFYDDLQS